MFRRLLWQNHRGFTLVEVVVASTILLTILVAAFTAFRSTHTQLNSGTNNTMAVDGAMAVVSEAAHALAGANTLEIDKGAAKETKVYALVGGQAAGATASLDYNYASGVSPTLDISGNPVSLPSQLDQLTGLTVLPLDQSDNPNGVVESNALELTATVTADGQTATLFRVIKTAAQEVPHPIISVTVGIDTGSGSSNQGGGSDGHSDNGWGNWGGAKDGNGWTSDWDGHWDGDYNGDGSWDHRDGGYKDSGYEDADMGGGMGGDGGNGGHGSRGWNGWGDNGGGSGITPVLLVTGDKYITFDSQGELNSVTASINGNPVDPTTMYLYTGGLLAILVPNGQYLGANGNEYDLQSAGNTMQITETIPLPSDPGAGYTNVAAETQFNYSNPLSGNGGAYDDSGNSGWTPPNGFQNYLAYLGGFAGGSYQDSGMYDFWDHFQGQGKRNGMSQWFSDYFGNNAQSSQGYLAFFNSDHDNHNVLMYLPRGPVSDPYAEINNQSQAGPFSYTGEVTLPLYMYLGQKGQLWSNSDLTAGLVVSPTSTGSPVTSGFLYFGVRQYSDGTYAVFSDMRNATNASAPSADASYVKLAPVSGWEAYDLRVDANAALSQFTFYVDGQEVGQESVSAINGPAYTGVWQYLPRDARVIYSGLSVTGS